MSNVNHFINVVHSILKDNKIHSLNDLHSSFFSLSEKEKLEVYEEVDHLDNSLLMSAIEYSNSPLAFKLLDFGFDPNKPNINGVNPLINSIKYSQEDLALHLVDITNDLDFARFSNGKKNGDTALIYACNKDMPQVVKKLIEHGADPFYTNEFYQHALFYCIRNTEPALECFKYLFPIYNHKASSINILGNSIIEIIFRYGQIEHLETIAYHKIEFNDLNQEKINALKIQTSSSWANILNGAKGNSLDEFLILVNYWDKMKDMIKLQYKFINKEKHKEKNTISKI